MRPIPVIVALGIALAPFIPQPAEGQGIGPGLVISDIDADSDGRISKDEYVAYRDREFERFDRNGDGSLSPADFLRASTYRRALGDLEGQLGQADTNGDGLLSRQELHAAPTVIFDRADTSRNGYLSQSEIAAARAQIYAIR